ncbi:class I SAM-dependent methyltransferase [Rubripirellula amarantea]|nr:class I SAM-dependent methyltransferase [Rubripirellula amarantea]
MANLLHDLDENRDHYSRVLEQKPSLYYERFDQDLLEKQPLTKELVDKAFERLFPQKAGRLLDVGCGNAFYYPLLSRHANEIQGIDVCGPMIDEAKEAIAERGLNHCHVQEASALDLPFDDESMDVVFSWDFLHHVPDVPKTISEITRVLRPGGRYIALEPNIMNVSIAWYHFRRRSEWRLFLQNQFSIPRKLRNDFDVMVHYDNTIISFLNDRTWYIWKAADVLTSIPPFHFLSFRYFIDAVKRG